jgi:hypothetical protein
MTVAPLKKLPIAELVLCVPIIAGLVYTAWFYSRYGYLPQPYFYEPWGTFMDYIVVAEFAHNKDAFEVFGTIYPPLSFVLLKFLSWGPCYASTGGEEARACDLYGIGWIFGIYIIDLILIALAYRKIDARTALPRTIALGLGFPMTYALERGNLLLFCFATLLLAYGPLIRSARLRWVFAAMTVNFKVYLIGPIFAQLLRRRWRWFEGAALATVIVYLVSFAIYGEGTPKQIYDNITAYAGGAKGLTVLDLWYPSSFVPLRALLEGEALSPILTMIGSEPMKWALFAAGCLYDVAMVSAFAAVAAAWWRPQVVPMHRIIFFSIAVAIITSEVSGYTHILVLLFVFMEPWRGFGRKCAIVLGYILCIGIEIPIQDVPPIVRESYLSGGPVVAEFAIGFGSFLRPIILHILIVTLAAVTIADVWRRMLSEGWRLPSLARWNAAGATSNHAAIR